MQILTHPRFVGREDELARMRGWLQGVRAGRGGVVVVESDSGGGKSRFLEEVSQTILPSDEFWVLHGQALDQAAPKPFQTFQDVIEAVVQRAGENSAYAEGLFDRLLEDQQAITVAFPELGAAVSAPAASSGVASPDAFSENRLLSALVAFLKCLGTAEAPAVVILEDCQWADELTLALLERFQKAADEESIHVLLIPAFRSEAFASRAIFQSVAPVGWLVLSPLDRETSGDLLDSVAHPALPEDLRSTVWKASKGNPFLTVEICRGLVESEAVVLDDQRRQWKVTGSDVHSLIRSSEDAGHVLSTRLDLMPREVLEVLSDAAVIGKQFSLPLLAGISGISQEGIRSALEQAQARHLIWMALDRGYFLHDRIRELLLARLAPETRSSLHLKIAENLESTSPERVFELAYHFDRAGCPERAVGYAMNAGKLATQQCAFEVAEALYRVAERGGAPRDEICEALGFVLMLRGKYDESARLLVEAESQASTQIQKAKLRGMLGGLSFKKSDVEGAIQYFESALELLGYPVPQTRFGWLFGVFKGMTLRSWRDRFPVALENRNVVGEDSREELAMRFMHELLRPYWFRRGMRSFLWSHLNSMNWIEREGPLPLLSQSFSMHAVAMLCVPKLELGIWYARRSLRIAQSLGDQRLEALARSYLGMALMTTGRYPESLASLLAALPLFEKTGDHWESNNVKIMASLSTYMAGDLPSAVKFSEMTLQSGQVLGEHQAIGETVKALALAAGTVPSELLESELKRERQGDVHTGLVVQFGSALNEFYAGEFKVATEILRATWQSMVQAGIRNPFTFVFPAWLARAIRNVAIESGQRSAFAKEWRKALKNASKCARYYPMHRPLILREQALYAAMNGKLKKATRLATESLQTARGFGAKFDEAQAQLALALIQSKQGVPGAAQDAESARQLLRSLGGGFVLKDRWLPQ